MFGLNIRNNIPNTLTVIRIILLPVFLILLLYDYVLYALITFFFAGLTDILDGYIARHLDQRTELGSYLDPIADKVLVNSSLIVFSISSINDICQIIPLWFVVIVMSRDMIIICGYFVIFLIAGKIKVVPSREGKAASFFNVLLIGLILLFLSFNVSPHVFRYLVYLIYPISLLTVISGLKYIMQGVSIVNAGQNHISD